jgi:hypothetical protein
VWQNDGLFSYFAYGLGIHSALPLPQFLSATIACDVMARWGQRTDIPADLLAPEGSEPSYVQARAEEALLCLQGVGSFLVRQGREIVVIPEAGVEDRLLQPYIVEALMAVLLYQRGRLVLHGSAAAIRGSAIVILGPSGRGKSSLVAALHARGHGIVADDVTAVSAGMGSATAYPGFPQLKLRPKVAAALGYDPRSLLPIHPRVKKLAYRRSRGFPRQPIPLKGIYVYRLAKGGGPDIVPLRPQAILLELLRYSYGMRSLLQAERLAAHFLQCAELAGSVPTYRLRASRSLAALPDLARFVEAHHAHHTSSAPV